MVNPDRIFINTIWFKIFKINPNLRQSRIGHCMFKKAQFADEKTDFPIYFPQPFSEKQIQWKKLVKSLSFSINFCINLSYVFPRKNHYLSYVFPDRSMLFHIHSCIFIWFSPVYPYIPLLYDWVYHMSFIMFYHLMDPEWSTVIFPQLFVDHYGKTTVDHSGYNCGIIFFACLFPFHRYLWKSLDWW